MLRYKLPIFSFKVDISSSDFHIFDVHLLGRVLHPNCDGSFDRSLAHDTVFSWEIIETLSGPEFFSHGSFYVSFIATTFN